MTFTVTMSESSTGTSPRRIDAQALVATSSENARRVTEKGRYAKRRTSELYPPEGAAARTSSPWLDRNPTIGGHGANDRPAGAELRRDLAAQDSIHRDRNPNIQVAIHRSRFKRRRVVGWNSELHAAVRRPKIEAVPTPSIAAQIRGD